MAIAKPKIAPYGASFGEFDGDLLTSYSVSGDFDFDGLGRNNISDVQEFNATEKHIYDFVLARLGHPIVRVEITPFQVKTAIDEAIAHFYHHIPFFTKQFAVFNASANCNLYELPSYIINNLEYVAYKKSLLTFQTASNTLEFDYFIKYFQDNHLFTDFSVGEFNLLQIHLETIRKILSQEGTWDVLNGKYLQLSPTPVMTPDPVIIVYRGLDSATIHPAYLNWIQRYSLAICKGMVGIARGKFAVLPSPGGGASLDGETLRRESKEEIEILKLELLEEIEEPPTFTTF